MCHVNSVIYQTSQLKKISVIVKRRKVLYAKVYQTVKKEYLQLLSDTTDGKDTRTILKNNLESTSHASLDNLPADSF